ncbi:MAG: hypothetical protein PF693_07895 [Spirochaetia bacterium]|jgi:Flp pilus assembly protein TadB|nr:hypothetical protein [Spirochaetia bacterium]
MIQRLLFLIIFLASLILLKLTGYVIFLLIMYITGVIITIVSIKSYRNIKRNKKCNREIDDCD